MEKTIAGSSSVELLDSDMLVKSENCTDLFEQAVCNGKPTEDQEVTNPHQNTAGNTPSSFNEANDVQSIDHRKHEMNDDDGDGIHGSTEIFQPPDTSFSQKSGLFYCLKCGGRFRELENLVNHGKMKCSVRCYTCGKQFERVAALVRHKRAEKHIGRPRQTMPREPKKPVQCPADGNSYSRDAEDQEVANPSRSTAGNTSSSCGEVNSVQSIDDRKHEMNHHDTGTTEICQPPDTTFSQKSGLFYCLKCGGRFRKLENLVNHRKMKCSVRCYTCGKQFERVAALVRHKRAENHSRKPRQTMPREPKKPVQSADGNSFRRVAEDQEVKNSHGATVGEMSHSCNEANDVQSVYCRKHEMNDRDTASTEISQPPDSSFSRKSGLFYCLKCGCRFRKLENLVKHGQKNCSVRCCTCGKQFERVAALQRHRRAENHTSASGLRKPRQRRPREAKKRVECVCSHCGHVFKNSTQLKSHMLTHTGERPFQCRVAGCTKHFAQHSTRSFHERTHSEEMPHICAVCGRRFKHAVGVYLHMSLHTGQKPYHCTSCPMTFRKACNLQQHSHRHSGERPYSCTECPKRFKTKKTLERHKLALHSDEIPYHCAICDKGFKTSGNLHIHMRVHTRDRPFTCAVCGVRFAYAGSLKSHMQAHSCNA